MVAGNSQSFRHHVYMCCKSHLRRTQYVIERVLILLVELEFLESP